MVCHNPHCQQQSMLGINGLKQQTWGNVCPFCGSKQRVRNSYSFFKTGEVVQHQGERYLVVRQGTQGQIKDKKTGQMVPDGITRWWLQAGDGSLACIPEYAITRPSKAELSVIQ